MKQVAIPTLEFIKDNLDAGKSFEDQAEIQQLIYGCLFSMRVGFEEHSKLKIAWDAAFNEKDYKNFQWAFTKFDISLPIATSGVFFPERDFEGHALQHITAPVGSLALLGFNVIPIAGQTSIIFGWLDNKRQNRRFIESFSKITDDFLASAVVQFCFDTSDNIFVKPSWWANLAKIPKKYLLWNLRNSTPGDKQPDGLVPRSPPIIHAQVLERAVELVG